MEIEFKQYGGYNNPAKIIEIIIRTDSVKLTECVTDLNGKVDEKLIQNLRDILEVLEHKNELINQTN